MWLDETLSRQSGEADPFYLKTALPVLDRMTGRVTASYTCCWVPLFFQNINALRLACSTERGATVHPPA